MLHTVEEDLELCKEFKLSPAQLMFVKMLVKDPAYDDPDWKKKSYKMSLEYKAVLGGLDPDELADLVAREIIEDLNDFGKSLYDYYEINPKFAGNFELKVYPMPMELFDRYPGMFRGSNGRDFIGRTCSAEEIALEYLRAIDKDPEEHKRVIQDLEWAKKNNGIILGLQKFVLTRFWEVIRKSRNTHSNKASDVTIV
jgi:hypothetical protein